MKNNLTKNAPFDLTTFVEMDLGETMADTSHIVSQDVLEAHGAGEKGLGLVGMTRTSEKVGHKVRENHGLMILNEGCPTYPLVMSRKLLSIAIEIVGFPSKHCDFP